ncbi:MAG: hypothetical protein L3J25_11400 [Flavobacteriaceae bacterium]|nr:hypothetical protein [Flavobacteriaceae bacterium]
MKLIKLILIIATIMTKTTSAQNNLNIIGTYNIDSGAQLNVLENGNFAIIHYGGIQTGKWQIADNNTVHFTPNKKNTFELYGRHNKDLKGDTKIFFSGFEDNQTFIQLNATKKRKYIMQRIFNVDANCFSFPYVYTFNTSVNNLLLMTKKYDQEKGEILTFNNSEGYNDFIAISTNQEKIETLPFSALFKENTLYFKGKYYPSFPDSKRIPLEEDSEEIKFIRKFMVTEANKDTFYVNPSYNVFGGIESDEEHQDIHESHIFNKEKNAFINAKIYVEGEEFIKTDDSFHNMSIIYAYKVLKEFTQQEPKNYKIEEKSLFQVNCK